MILAPFEETLRLIRAFRVSQNEEARRNIIFIEAAAAGADVKQEPQPPRTKPN